MSKLFEQTKNSRVGAQDNGLEQPLEIAQLVSQLKEALPSAKEEAPTVVQDLSALVESLRNDSAAPQFAQTQLQGIRTTQLTSSFSVLGGEEEHVLAIEGYSSLRTRLLRLQTTQGIRSVVVTSAVQGEGKTTTAANLAISCAQLRNTRVLLVDGDLRTGGLGRLFGNPAPPGLAEVLAGKAEFQHAVVATTIAGLYLAGAGQAATPPPELLASGRWKEFLGWAVETFKLVVIDSPPVIGLTDFELLAAPCDGILAVVRAFKTERETLREAIAQFDKQKLLGIVLNGATPSPSKGYYNYYYGTHRKNKS